MAGLGSQGASLNILPDARVGFSTTAIADDRTFRTLAFLNHHATLGAQ